MLKVKLLLVIVLALFLRVCHHSHILMSDEANNMLTIKAIIEGEGLRGYFFKHPPLFIIVSSMISYPFGDSFHVVQGISIAFSILSFIPLYLVVKRLFDARAALLSLLFLSILPLNILYSTWAKQEAMLLFFFLWSMYFYITQKPFKSGLLFGIASLTKEFAWFLIPIVAGWEVLRGWEGRDSLKRLLSWFLVGLLVSGWWYAIWGIESFKAIRAAATGGEVFEFAWHYPWYYYLRNLPEDITLVLVAFLVIGLISTKCGPRLLFLLWVMVFYLPLSVLSVKAPWYVYLASPAIVVITAAGFLRVGDMVRTNWLRRGIALAVMVSMASTLYVFDGTKYYLWLLSRRLPYLDYESPGFYEKKYLDKGREVLKGEGKIALLEYNPTLQYYLGISDRRIFYAGSQFMAMDAGKLKALIDTNKLGYFVISRASMNYTDKNLADLSSLWGEPLRVGNVFIYKVSDDI